MTRKVIVRIKGGLGNQLFSYAAARRLALANNAELVLDDVTGFVRDHQYRRSYALDHFNITARKATSAERLEPFERLRRGVAKSLARRTPFEQRKYLEQEGIDFDSRLLDYFVPGTVYLDGYWQGENYFKDAEAVIRRDLAITPPADERNRAMATQIASTNAIGVHVRWFNRIENGSAETVHGNLSVSYYRQAIQEIKRHVQEPRFFIFSDDPVMAVEVLALSESTVCVDHNHGDQNAYADLWLMTQCRHFIIANSTFSWWGAWLAESSDKLVLAPAASASGISAWGFAGLLPETWITIP